MLNPTLTDLIGGIQTVTLGDEEARRRRSQKSVLERKAPPTFDVIVEILDRERVTVHADVADTVDALLRGDPITSELRWRDEGGVHRSQSRPKPSPREALSGGDRFGSDRFAGLVGAGPGWRTEPGWRGGASHGAGDWREAERTGLRPGYRSGTSGGWRAPVRGPRGVHDAPRRPRGDSGGGAGSGGGAAGGPGGAVGGPGGSGGSGLEGATRNARPPASEAGARTLPGERFATSPFGPERGSGDAPFRAGDIADRGPIERGAPPVPEPRPRELRELERQRSWREQATRALNTYRAGEVTEEDEEEVTAQAAPQSIDEDLDADDEAIADRVRGQAGDDGFDDEDGGRPVLRVRDGATVLPTLRVFPHGISRKRLEQGVKELQLPVIIARDPDEADVVMTLKSEYRQKTTALRDAEERGLPIYVLKSNTVVQMEASLTSIFSLEVDPREAALLETEEAIGLVFRNIEPVELSPQNAYIRRLQHQMAERANLVSRSRGREPYRRVRLYP